MTDSSVRDLHLTVGKGRILAAAKKIREHYRSEFNNDIPQQAIVDAISKLLEAHLDRFTEDLFERLTSPHRSEAGEFRSFLEGQVKPAETADASAAESPASVFSGHRPYSFEKFAAMTAYIAARGREVYKTKLNKLLFYSDFINFYLHESSISGAKYVHAPYGPVPEKYETAIKELAQSGDIRVVRHPGFEEITAGDGAGEKELSPDERASIDWVLDNIGWMTASEISEFSHREQAYRFTRTGENIAYEYVKFFQKLPSRTAGGSPATARDGDRAD